MYMLPDLPSFGGIDLHKNLRMHHFSKDIMPQYDICCLQEVFYTVNSRKENLTTIAQHSGFPYHAKSSLPGLFTGKLSDGGLLTLSRFPIIESEFKPYPIGVFSDAIS
jgi:sphingomyelin phosphodiesterase